MKKKKSKFSKLPKWFNRKNYRLVNRLSKEEWFYELWLRRLYYQTPITGVFYEKNLESYFGARKFIEHSSKAAIADIDNYDDCSVCENSELVFTGLLTQGLYFKKLKPKRPDFLLPLKQLSREDIIKGRIRHDRAVLEVNLLSADSVLVCEFEKWLKLRRQEMSNTVNASFLQKDGRNKGEIVNIHLKKELQARADSGLLPYLDLYQWSCLTGAKIKQKDYAEAVLSSPYHSKGDFAESFKNTTKKSHAANVSDFLIKLEKQLEIVLI